MARPKKSSDMAAIIDQAKALLTSLEKLSNTVSAALQDAETLKDIKPLLAKLKTIDTPANPPAEPPALIPANPENITETTRETPWSDGWGDHPDDPPAEIPATTNHKKKKKE
jgi:hypothetical protein